METWLGRLTSTLMKKLLLHSNPETSAFLQNGFTARAVARARQLVWTRTPATALGLITLLLLLVGSAQAQVNLAPSGSGIMGFIDSDTSPNLGTVYFHGGNQAAINDGLFDATVDTFSGGSDGGQGVGFVGVLWPSLRAEQITNLTLYVAAFFDGGWFGPNALGPGASGTLDGTYLTEPKVQISTNHGTSWINVPSTSDYLTALNGLVLPVAFGPPSQAVATFQISPAVTNINGIRIIGSNGGTADGNGFLGTFELEVTGVVTDSDSDGMPDGWEMLHPGLVVGVNDAGGDLDSDGLSNLLEFQSGTDPNNPDSDGDGYLDGEEVAAGSNPINPGSIPTNLARSGLPILGTTSAWNDTSLDTPIANAGSANNVNDENLTTHVDTYNPSPDTLSYVGITWDPPLTNTVNRLALSLAVFFDGGWFGTNNLGPGSGSVLTTNQYLAEPIVQASGDGGVTWTNVPFVSDYLTALEGQPTPAVNFGPPTLGTAHFQLTPPLTNVNGVRIIGSEGGTASGGFLGIFDLAVLTGEAQSVQLINPQMVGSEFSFQFQSRAGAGHRVEYKNALSDSAWQTLKLIAGDGTLKQVTDNSGGAQRLYRVSSY